MHRFLFAAVSLFAFASVGCGELVVPSDEDAGVSVEIDGGEGTCSPDCGENASCNSDNVCECDPGFEGDGTTCDDVDECATNNGGCDENATCFNTPGASTCVCNANYEGDGLTCFEIWSLLGESPGINIDPQGFGTIAVGHRDSVFFGARTNDVSTLFMRSFDVTNGQFSDPLPLPNKDGGDFCACGLGEAFVSDGTFMYLLGNDGNRYDPETERWTRFTPWTSAVRRGEAGVTYDSLGNNILTFGGRNNTFNSQRFSLEDLGDVQSDPGAPPIALDEPVAVTPEGSEVSFVAVRNPENNSVQLLSHPTVTSEWEVLPAAPAGLTRPVAMGTAGNNGLWVADRDGLIFAYDFGSDTWTPQGLGAPAGTLALVQVQGEVVALASVGGAVQVWRLNPPPPPAP